MEYASPWNGAPRLNPSPRYAVGVRGYMEVNPNAPRGPGLTPWARPRGNLKGAQEPMSIGYVQQSLGRPRCPTCLEKMPPRRTPYLEGDEPECPNCKRSFYIASQDIIYSTQKKETYP